MEVTKGLVMEQCEKGHFYDASLPECPVCKAEAEQMNGSDPNILFPSVSPDLDITRSASDPTISSEGKTIALIDDELGYNPVVGWLVSISGNEKGRDYRIVTGNNYIGRSERENQISLRGDQTISKTHALIAYDPVDKQFYFAPFHGLNLVRLNGKAVLAQAELKAYDVLTIGKTNFVFVPLCGEQFEWKEEE